MVQARLLLFLAAAAGEGVAQAEAREAPERSAPQLLPLLLPLVQKADAFKAPAPAPRRLRARSGAPVALADKRWNDPILDENIPDPVYDLPSGYKGRSLIGFNDFAEKLNGRAAMMGFVILFLQELIAGKGVLEQYGLPYDPGAVIGR